MKFLVLSSAMQEPSMCETMWFNLLVDVLRFHDENGENLGFNVYSKYLVKKQEINQKRQSLLFIESSNESKHRKRF